MSKNFKFNVQLIFIYPTSSKKVLEREITENCNFYRCGMCTQFYKVSIQNEMIPQLLIRHVIIFCKI